MEATVIIPPTDALNQAMRAGKRYLCALLHVSPTLPSLQPLLWSPFLHTSTTSGELRAETVLPQPQATYCLLLDQCPLRLLPGMPHSTFSHAQPRSMRVLIHPLNGGGQSLPRAQF